MGIVNHSYGSGKAGTRIPFALGGQGLRPVRRQFRSRTRGGWTTCIQEFSTVHRKNVNSAFIGTTLEADLRARAESVLSWSWSWFGSPTIASQYGGNLGFRTVLVGDATAAFEGPRSTAVCGPGGGSACLRTVRSPGRICFRKRHRHNSQTPCTKVGYN